MKRLFTQMAEHKIKNADCSEFLKKLPYLIYTYTDWPYKYQQRNDGYFLKPIFRNTLYRNSFIPEIDIVVSNVEDYTMLHITGRPVKFIRVFMTFWMGLLSLIEVYLLILAITSKLNGIFPVFIPIIMCLFGYLLCELSTKVAFNSVVKVIKEENE